MKNIDTSSSFVRLLVVDDDDADKLLLKRALRTCGFQYELTEYSDTTNISDTNALNSFDCIFLDYLLPGDNGLFLLKKIRDNGVRTPIVIITSQGNEHIAVELMKAGASDYIVKNEIDGQSLGQVLMNIQQVNKIMKEREEAYRALRISESRLAEAQQIAKLGSWEFDNEQNAFFLSPAVYNILEQDPRNFFPTIDKLLDLIHIEDRDTVNAIWKSAIQGKPFDIDFRINTSSKIKFTHSQGRVVLNSEGQLEKIIGTLQDITERKSAEHEIMKAREQAENSMKVREVFLANMSHEIRTPMNAILGFTRLLCETTPTAEQKAYIDAIHFSGENLLVIINDILDLSKIQSGKMTIEKCEFDLHELISGIIAVLRPKALEKGLRLTSKIGSQIPSVIQGDSVRLNQILTNLISNAIKFTEKGSVSLEINSIISENHDILLEFKVTDTGIGIPADKQSLVFENFVQASSDTTRKYGGTGLGLAIVKSLVELQDGKISVESTLREGSTFTVHLPYEKVNHQLPRPSQQLSSVNDSMDQLRGTMVLVAEDNLVNQMLVRKVLDKVGCKVDIASNGLEAIERLKSKKYEVILMDVQMPEMDGFETTRYIRNQLPGGTEIPIIAMTAHAFGSDVTKCLTSGMNDYISKPFKSEELYSKLIKYVQGSQPAKVVKMSHTETPPPYQIDMSSLYELGASDQEFINDFILLYDKQTPAFIEKLKGYTKSQNFEAIKSICHQIKSSYGMIKMKELDKTLNEISELLTTEDKQDVAKVNSLVNVIISLISAITQEVKRNLRKAG
jgi:signal transduction histidine kinase/HPt (histidine-containing phosphotransfer) domain-containing protein